MRLSLLAIMSLIFALMSLAQADTITISSSTPFAENSGASDNVKEECKFETRLPNYIKKAAKQGVVVVLWRILSRAPKGRF